MRIALLFLTILIIATSCNQSEIDRLQNELDNCQSRLSGIEQNLYHLESAIDILQNEVDDFYATLFPDDETINDFGQKRVLN